MADQKNTSSETTTNDQKMDAIKQLIFGENMVEYDQRFEEVVSRIEATQASLEMKLQNLELNMNSVIDDLNSEFENKRLKLEDHFNILYDKLDNNKTDRKALGKMLANIGNKLQG